MCRGLPPPKIPGVTASDRFPHSGTPQFHTRDGELYCEGLRAAELVAEHGTPLYVYSANAIRDRYQVLRSAFGDDALICYAVKANPNLAILRELHALGAGFDIVSGGELARLRRAGLPTAQVVFAGVGKTRPEIEAAVDAGILGFHVESEQELALIERVAAAQGERVGVALRLNPDVTVATHAYISTGAGEHKFGLDRATASRLALRIADSGALRLAGYHVHLGSQLGDPAPYARAFDRVEDFLDADPRHRQDARYFDLGGGVGIAYGDGGELCDVAAIAAAVAPRIRARGLRPVLEPGRYLVGDAGVLLTRVLGTKLGTSKRFLIVDAAMNDLLRPALYAAHHPIVPLRSPGRPAVANFDVVGPVCETGDFLGRGVALPALDDGELLAILAAGAYGSSMASNYNSRCRPAEVLVDGLILLAFLNTRTVRFKVIAVGACCHPKLHIAHKLLGEQLTVVIGLQNSDGEPVGGRRVCS